MARAFRCIGLIGKFGDPNVGATIHTLSAHVRQRGLKVLLDEATAELVPGHGLDIAERSELGKQCDLVIVIGGDGTLLNAARSLANYEVPLLGVNQGRLGFLADISPDHMLERLDEILAGQYTEEERLLLHTVIYRNGQPVSGSDAFNDVVLHKWNAARMIEFDTRINGQFVNTYRSDGLIVATPTGSTAYALSSDGPILYPTLDVIVLVPICPHTMSNRPIVVNGDSQIEITVRDIAQSAAQLTCDGQINLGVLEGDLIKIYKKHKCARLIHPANHDYYEMLRAKLHWGEKL
ncbi:MAG: NAD(+) kinase [Proteobacteria bacterium]|nr:NAD(+) kinase [Pseudomonadota bacterium]